MVAERVGGEGGGGRAGSLPPRSLAALTPPHPPLTPQGTSCSPARPRQGRHSRRASPSSCTLTQAQWWRSSAKRRRSWCSTRWWPPRGRTCGTCWRWITLCSKAAGHRWTGLSRSRCKGEGGDGKQRGSRLTPFQHRSCGVMSRPLLPRLRERARVSPKQYLNRKDRRARAGRTRQRRSLMQGRGFSHGRR